MSDQKAWLVERARDQFETIRAESMTIERCGALKFWSGHLFEPRLDVLFAPGQWVSVVMDEAASDE